MSKLVAERFLGNRDFLIVRVQVSLLVIKILIKISCLMGIHFFPFLFIKKSNFF